MSRFTDEDIDRIAEAVVLKLTGRPVSEIHIHNPPTPQWVGPQWWQPGGSPTC